MLKATEALEEQCATLQCYAPPPTTCSAHCSPVSAVYDCRAHSIAILDAPIAPYKLNEQFLNRSWPSNNCHLEL